MLNQLKTFSMNLEKWGFKVPLSVHPKVKPNSKGEAYLVIVGADGSVHKVTNFGEQFPTLRTVREDNHTYGFTFKFAAKGDIENLRKATARRLQFTLTTAQELLSYKPGRDEFEHLSKFVSALEKVKTEAFVNAVLDELKQLESKAKEVYLALDIKSRVVQVPGFFEAVSDVFFQFDKALATDSKDCFGNPMVADAKQAKMKIIQPVGSPTGMVRPYSRNEANDCFAIFGKNSTELCPFGTTTENEIISIGEYLFAGNNQAIVRYDKKTKTYSEQKGFWFFFKDADGTEKYVFSSIYPHDSLIDGIAAPQKLSDANYQTRMKNIMQGLVKQMKIDEVAAGPGTKGEVLVISASKGPWHVESSRIESIHKTAERVQQWHDGLYNGPRWAPGGREPQHVGVMDIMRQFNKRWLLRGNKYESQYQVRNIRLQDAYDFFFGDKQIVRRFSQIFAREFAPMLVGACSSTIESRPFDLTYLVPIRNLLLHKLGYITMTTQTADGTEQKVFDHWAFHLGELFKTANDLYWRFFKYRKSPIPRILIGQQYADVAYQNPQRALAGFNREFRKCLTWAENNGLYKSHVLPLSELQQKVNASQPLPVRMSDVEANLFSAGYLNVTRPVAPKEEKTNEEQ